MKERKYRVRYEQKRNKFSIQRREWFLFIPFWSTFSDMGFRVSCEYCTWYYYDNKHLALKRLAQIIEDDRKEQEMIKKKSKTTEEFTEAEFFQKYPELNI